MKIKKENIVGFKKYNRDSIHNLYAFMTNFIERGYVINEYYSYVRNESDDRIDFSNLDELKTIINNESAIKCFNIKLDNKNVDFTLTNTSNSAGWIIEYQVETYEESAQLSHSLKDYVPLLRLNSKFLYHLFNSTSYVYAALSVLAVTLNIFSEDIRVYIMMFVLLLFLTNVIISIIGVFFIPFKDNNNINKKIFKVILYILGVIFAAVIGALIDKWI